MTVILCLNLTGLDVYQAHQDHDYLSPIKFKVVNRMAKNGAKGKGRHGAVKGRKQYKNPKTGLYVKIDTKTGKFMDNKTSGGPFKGVTKG